MEGNGFPGLEVEDVAHPSGGTEIMTTLFVVLYVISPFLARIELRDTAGYFLQIKSLILPNVFF